MKECGGCGRVLPYTCFKGAPHAPDGRAGWCKTCTVEQDERIANDGPAVVGPLVLNYDLVCLSCSYTVSVRWTEQRGRLEQTASRYRCKACRGAILVEECFASSTPVITTKS